MGGWVVNATCQLLDPPPRKDPVPTVLRLGGPQGQSGWMWIALPPPGFDPQTFQLVVSRYTNRAILARI
jgi:hypothetical protein